MEENRPRAGRNVRAQRPKRRLRFPKGEHAICKASRIRCRPVTATPEATAQSSTASRSPETPRRNPAGHKQSRRAVSHPPTGRFSDMEAFTRPFSGSYWKVRATRRRQTKKEDAAKATAQSLPPKGEAGEPLGRWPRGLPRCSWPATTRTHASRSGAPGGRPKAASEVNHGAGCVVKQEEEPRQTARGGREQRWRRPRTQGAAGRRRAA